jgi:hypothetical protein
MKKSLGCSIRRRLCSAVCHKKFKLLTIKRTTPAQVAQRIRNQPETGFAFIGGRKIFEGRSVQRDGPETFHPGVARTRQHGRAAALKYRNTKAALIIERKPITICASHGKKSFHAFPLGRSSASAHFSNHVIGKTVSEGATVLLLKLGVEFDIKIPGPGRV